MVELEKINDVSILEQYFLDENITELHQLAYDETTSLGSGGFGDVFPITTINHSLKKGYVAKVLKGSNAKHGFEAITHLHNSIKHEAIANNEAPTYLENPFYLGIPFLTCKCKIEGKTSYVLVMPNLKNIGYEDLGEDDNTKKNVIENLETPDQFYLGYQFILFYYSLHRLNFMHFDIKKDVVWINPETKKLCIIDLDGGYDFKKQSKPTARTDNNLWKKTTSFFKNIIVTREDRMDQELEMITFGLFELLFGSPPLFFLRERNKTSEKKYFDTYKWPEVDFSDEELFRIENKDYYNYFLEHYKEMTDSLPAMHDCFSRAINDNEAIKLKEWLGVFSDIIEGLGKAGQIESSAFSKEFQIHKPNEEISFNIATKNLRYVKVNGKYQFIEENTVSVSVQDEGEIILEAFDYLGETITHTIPVKAVKNDPIIVSYTTSTKFREEVTPVTLTWETENVEKVNISNIVSDLPASGKTNVEPKEKTVYFLEAFSPWGNSISQEIVIDVEKPVINNFMYEFDLKSDLQAVKLHWKVEKAEIVNIHPGSVDESLEYPKGNTITTLEKPTLYELIVHGKFSKVSRKLMVSPFPIPIIKELQVPTPALSHLGDFNYNTLSIEDFDNMPRIENVNLNISNLIEKTNEEIEITQNPLSSFETNNFLIKEPKIPSIRQTYNKLKQSITSKLNK